MMKKQPFERAVSAHGVTVLRVCRAVLGPRQEGAEPAREVAERVGVDAAAARLAHGGVTQREDQAVERLRAHTGGNPLHIGALYWHLVDVIWIFLWPLFYLTGGGHG